MRSMEYATRSSTCSARTASPPTASCPSRSSSDMFLQLLVNGLVTGSVYAIAAVGVSLVYGLLRLVNFAYGDMMAFGALITFGVNGPLHQSMIVAALVGMAATAILALLLDFALWRPLRIRRAGFMSLFLASIGLALVLRQALLLFGSAQPRTYRVDPYRVFVIGSVRLSEAQHIAIVAAAVTIVLVALFLSYTTTGRVLRAMADDRALAAVAGVDVGAAIRIAWLIAGALAGLAGVLAALVEYSFDPNFGFQLLLP